MIIKTNIEINKAIIQIDPKNLFRIKFKLSIYIYIYIIKK
jgi:hypothetical protein